MDSRRDGEILVANSANSEYCTPPRHEPMDASDKPRSRIDRLILYQRYISFLIERELRQRDGKTARVSHAKTQD